MVDGNAAINLFDAIFTLQACTTGDDGNPSKSSSGSAITFKADKVSVKLGRTLTEHGTPQNPAEFNRITKMPESVVVETKLEKKASAKLFGMLIAGAVVIFAATATGCSVSTPAGGCAIVESVEPDIASPSTLRFTLRQYGAQFVVSNS